MPHPPIDTGFRRKRHPRCVPRLSPIEAQSLGMSSRSCYQLTLRRVRAINGVTQSTNHLVLVPSWSGQESKGTQRRRYGPSQDAHIRQCLKRHGGRAPHPATVLLLLRPLILDQLTRPPLRSVDIPRGVHSYALRGRGATWDGIRIWNEIPYVTSHRTAHPNAPNPTGI